MSENHAEQNAAAWLASILEMVAALDAETEGDAAFSAIHESVLDVSVRTDWFSPGQQHDASVGEYAILLTTGGPALRLTGALDADAPDAWPRLEFQDWGTPWTEYLAAREHRAALQRFAACFYFGEG